MAGTAGQTLPAVVILSIEIGVSAAQGKAAAEFLFSFDL